MEFKIRDILLKLFSVIFVLVSIYILCTSIFNSSELFTSLKSIIIIFGSALLLFILYLLDKKLMSLQNKTLKIISAVALSIMVILQIAFAIIFLVYPSWDYGVIFYSAEAFVKGNTALDPYFYIQYPNNIGVVLLLICIFKVVNIFTQDSNIFLGVAILFNIAMINLAIYILYKFIKKSFGQSKATLLSIMILFITPFYTYSQIVYTDTITMVFPILMFFMLDKFISTDTREKNIYLIIIGVVGAIGTILKTNIIIAYIAILIYILLKDKIKIAIKNIFIILLSFIIIMGGYQSVASKFIPVEYKEAGLPFTHWVMMGLNQPYGGYNAADVDFSLNLKLEQGKALVKEENIKEIKKRLLDYGVKDYLTFVNKKVSVTWGDGTYFATDKLSRQPMWYSNLREYILGSKNILFMYMSQFSHVIILAGIFIASIINIKKYDNLNQGIHICIFGVFLFLILWETRSRYLLCYLPLLVYAGFNGLNYGFKIINNKIDKKTKELL